MRRIKGAVVGMAALGLVLLAGCGAGGNDNGTSESGASAPMKGGAADGKAASGAPLSQGQPGQEKPAEGQPEDQPPLTRAIIKTGSLTVEADNVDAKRQQAITIIKESDDVTEQVVDVQSRIASQRASLERMRTLLTKANTIGEIVTVESELTRREADLESLLAKQKNLALQTELATLALTLTEKGEVPPPKQPDRGFLAGLKSGWNAFTATFGALATAIGAILPFLVLLALIAVPLWLLRHRLRRQPAAQAPDAGQ